MINISDFQILPVSNYAAVWLCLAVGTGDAVFGVFKMNAVYIERFLRMAFLGHRNKVFDISFHDFIVSTFVCFHARIV